MWRALLSWMALAIACGGKPPPVVTSSSVLPPDVRLVPQIGHAAGALAISPDGSLIASAGDGAVKVWSTSSGLLVQSFATVHDRAVAFAPDGRTLVSSGRAVVAWSLAPLRETGHDEPAPSFDEDARPSYRAVAIAPDGKRRAFGMEGVIKAGTGLRVVEGDRVAWTGDTGGDVLALAYARDGATLMTLGKDGVTRAWDAASGRARWASTAADALEWWAHTAIAFAPGGELVATCEHRQGVAVRKLATGELVHRYPDSCTGLAFLDDATLAVFGATSAALDIATGAAKWTLPADVNAAFGLASADGKLLAIAGDRGLQIWTADGQLLRSLRGRRSPAVAGCLSPDGATAVAVRPDVGDRAGRADVEVWSLREARQTARWTIAGPSYQSSGARSEACAIAPDGRAVVIPTLQGLRMMDLATGTLRNITSTLLYKVAFVPGRPELLVASQDDVYRLALADGKVLATYSGGKLVDAIGISADHTRVAATTVGGETISWDAAGGPPLARAATTPMRRGDQTIAFRGAAVIPDPNPLENRVVSADDRWIVQLEDGVLTSLDARTGKPARQRIALATQQQLQIVGLAADARSALVIDSAMLRVARLDTGHVFTLAGDGDDWLLYTEDGYFDSSRNAGAMLAAARGLEVYRIDQLALRNNRPDKILERTGVANPDAIPYYHARYLHRLAALGLDEGSLSSKLGDAPNARIRSIAVVGDHANLEIEMDAPAGLLAYEIYVNGVALHGGGGWRVSGTHVAKPETVPLTAGDNRIEVGAISKSGVEGLRPTRVVRREGKPARRELYFVGFGVSKYKNTSYNLDYPSKDIVDLADVLRAAPGFDAVHAETFVDATATVSSFAVAKHLLEQATVDDTVIVFVAGHGLHAHDATADYYFATYETDIDDLAHTAASFAVIDSLLDGLAARKKLLLLDTCESGDLVADDVATVAATRKNLASRGLARVHRADSRRASSTAPAQPATAPKRPREYVLARDRFILADLARRTGAVVLASSRGEELSYESTAVQNGLFTQAMLLALTGPEADADRDGAVSPQELRAFVTRNVAASTDDLQHPTIDVDNPFANIALPITPAARPIVDRP